MPIESQAVGKVEVFLTVNVKAQVDGELTRAFFLEGDFVRKGDPLLEIDRRALESQLDQSKANLARDEAQLGMAEANLARDEAQEKYALAESERQATLLKKGLASREEAEQVRANAEAISAAVRADAASIRSEQAAVVNAEVQLGYTTILPPWTAAAATSVSNRATWSTPTRPPR